MSDEPTILMARQPARFEARNCRGRHKRLKGGSIWLIEMEVDRETWDLLDTMPDNALLETVLWWSDGDPVGNEKPAEPEPKTAPDAFDGVAEAYEESDGPAQALPPGEPVKREPGPWGGFWAALYAHGFMNNGPLMTFLHVSGKGDTVKVALKKRLNVESLTDCNPDHIQAWLVKKIREGAPLHGALEITEKVVEKMGGAEYKWKKDKQEGTAA